MSIFHVNAVLNLTDPELKDARQVALITLANYADPDGFCFPSVPTLAAIARRSTKQMRRILEWLACQDRAYIRVVETGNGRGHKTLYQVTLKGDTTMSSGAIKGDIAMSPFSKKRGTRRDAAEQKKGDIIVSTFTPLKGDISARKVDIGSHACVDPSINKDLDLIDDLSIYPVSDSRVNHKPTTSLTATAAEPTPPSAAPLPASWSALQVGPTLDRLAEQCLTRGWQEANLLAAYQVSRGKENPDGYLYKCLNGDIPTAPKPAPRSEQKRNYQPDGFFNAPQVRVSYTQQYAEMAAARGVRVEDAVQVVEEEVPAAAPSTAPMEDPPSGYDIGAPGADLDDLEPVWAQTQHDFLLQNPQAAEWLKGSVLEATDELDGGKPLYHVVVADRAQVDWLSAHLFTVKRSLSVSFKHPVAVRVVTVAAIPLDAFRRKQPVTA